MLSKRLTEWVFKFPGSTLSRVQYQVMMVCTARSCKSPSPVSLEDKSIGSNCSSPRFHSGQNTFCCKIQHSSGLLRLDGSGLGDTRGLDRLRSFGGGGRTRRGVCTRAGGGCLSLGLLGAKDTLKACGLVSGATVLLLLKLSQTTCLGVYVLELLLTLVVCSAGKLLATHTSAWPCEKMECNIQKSTSFFPVGVLVAFSKYEFRPENSELALVVMP